MLNYNASALNNMYTSLNLFLNLYSSLQRTANLCIAQLYPGDRVKNISVFRSYTTTRNICVVVVCIIKPNGVYVTTCNME